MKILTNLFRWIFIFGVSWVLATNWRYVGLQTGLFTEKIDISGTGSMYPTFPKGTATSSAGLAEESVITVHMRQLPAGLHLFNYNFFDYQLQRGDIVSFSNQETAQITTQEVGKPFGFVKRLIALPGDTLEIRDGYVLLNNTRLVEPYIASARSTFGGNFLPDCQKLTIPAGQAFVLGDNRKGSSDSRFDLGLVSLSDIDHVLPLTAQKPYQGHWRNTSADFTGADTPVLDVNQYLNLLNTKRIENGLKPLKYQSKLAQSAAKRADIIIKYNDFSFAATRSGYTMDRAMQDVGYSNIVWGESPTRGFYDAQELIDNFMAFQDSKKFILQKDFQETGIAVKLGQINGCPVQVVVQHFAGYKPPDYSQQVISQWQQILDVLQKAYPNWQKIKDYRSLYNLRKSEFDEMLTIFQTRIDHISAIVSRMKANQWLTKQEEQWLEDDQKQSQRMDVLTQKLNQL